MYAFLAFPDVVLFSPFLSDYFPNNLCESLAHVFSITHCMSISVSFCVSPTLLFPCLPRVLSLFVSFCLSLHLLCLESSHLCVFSCLPLWFLSLCALNSLFTAVCLSFRCSLKTYCLSLLIVCLSVAQALSLVHALSQFLCLSLPGTFIKHFLFTFECVCSSVSLHLSPMIPKLGVSLTGSLSDLYHPVSFILPWKPAAALATAHCGG